MTRKSHSIPDCPSEPCPNSLDSHFLWMAGVYSTLTETYAIITVEASTDMQSIHNRMPLIFCKREQVDQWLQKGWKDPLLKACYPLENELLLTPVSSFVNQSRNNSPRCIAYSDHVVQGPMDRFVKRMKKSINQDTNDKDESSIDRAPNDTKLDI